MTTVTKNYNGWTNYETWNVKLWMDNSQGDQEYWNEQAQEAYDKANGDSNFTRLEQASFDLREILKEHFENFIQEILENAKLQASFVADLLRSALSEVNWQEIAESLLGEIEEVEE